MAGRFEQVHLGARKLNTCWNVALKRVAHI
jgi:hypothetical protein